MIQKAIDELTSFLAIIPKNDRCWQQQAYITIAFARKMSEDLLKATGFAEPESEQWKANMLAVSVKSLDAKEGPVGLVSILHLKNVPPTLTAEHEIRVPTSKALYFCTGRVVDWDEDHHVPKAVLSYEEAARMVVFWLMAKMLCICQVNEWDRVRSLPAMIDRMAEMIAFPSAQDRILNESVWSIKFSGQHLAHRFQFAMQNERVGTIREFLEKFKSRGQLHRTKNIGDKVCHDVEKWMKDNGLRFGMRI